MSAMASEAQDGSGSVNDDDQQDFIAPGAGLAVPPVELLMFALPHHQERLRPTAGSSNAVKNVGCQANLHGLACPVSISFSELILRNQTNFVL